MYSFNPHTTGHRSTLAYILSVLSTPPLAGFYRLAQQPFPAVSGAVFSSRLVLGDTVPRTASAMSLSPPTPHHEPVFAPLALVSAQGCAAGDFGSSVNGSVALVERGGCAFGTKSALAGKAGARALVVYNNEPGSVSGTLGTPEDAHVPTFGIAREEALDFVKALNNGDKIEAIAYVDSVVSLINTTNIVAQTVAGDQENYVMLGAHSDSVSEGPGINDDGSGTLSLLEVATALAGYAVNNCVRFAWWSGEEEGLLGSDYYVQQLEPEENLRIRLFMDYDMLASPNFAYQVYDARDAVNPKGSQALRDLYTTYYEEKGVNWTYIPFDGRSDYDGFIRNGIPGGGIATGAEVSKSQREQAMFGGEAGVPYDKCYHQLCDNVGNVNVTAWVLNTKVRRLGHHSATLLVSHLDRWR